MMSLNARDKQALDRIEEEVACSDPRFAARLSAFSRLADGWTMPDRERIRPDGQRPGRRMTRRGLAWATAVVWLVTSLGLIAVALITSHAGGSAPCTQWQTTACASRD